MCNIKCLKYITETKVFVLSGQFDSLCNSLLIINTGTDPVSIDGLILQQNQSWSIEGNYNEILIKTYSFTFQNINAVQSLTVIYKRYVD